MKWMLFSLLFSINYSFADIGKITNIIGKQGGYLQRNQEKVLLAPGLILKVGDVISSKDSLVVIQIFPTSQMSLAMNSQIKLTEYSIEIIKNKENPSFAFDFIQGTLRIKIINQGVQATSQRIRTSDVSFEVDGTEFEVSISSQSVELDVWEGSVKVSSPHVHTFVPEIIKDGEGFRYSIRQKSFSRRTFSPHAEFEGLKNLEKASLKNKKAPK